MPKAQTGKVVSTEEDSRDALLLSAKESMQKEHRHAVGLDTFAPVRVS